MNTRVVSANILTFGKEAIADYPSSTSVDRKAVHAGAAAVFGYIVFRDEGTLGGFCENSKDPYTTSTACELLDAAQNLYPVAQTRSIVDGLPWVETRDKINLILSGRRDDELSAEKIVGNPYGVETNAPVSPVTEQSIDGFRAELEGHKLGYELSAIGSYITAAALITYIPTVLVGYARRRQKNNTRMKLPNSYPSISQKSQ